MQPLRPTTDPAIRDQYLWQVAKARTKFQGHLVVYVIINAGLWLLWALLPAPHATRDLLPWPVWSTVFWGFGLAMQGFAAYSSLNRGQRTQREYERLLSQQRY